MLTAQLARLPQLDEQEVGTDVVIGSGAGKPLRIGVDYMSLDGRGGGTGAAPSVFKEDISIPTISALARARRHLDRLGRDEVTLIVTGGLRTAADFVKALALGADGIAVSNAAIQAIGCLGMRARGHTHLDQFAPYHLTTWKRDMAYLSGVAYAGVMPVN